MGVMKHVFLLLGIIALLGSACWAGSAQDDEDLTASIRFVVVRDYNGKPVRNAGVVMHPVNKKGKQSRGGLELKTNAEGKASFDGVPYGTLRVQVLAPGLQTFGEDYEINKPDIEITVKLKRPQGQYSIYEDHPANKDGSKDQPQNPPPSPDQKPQR